MKKLILKSLVNLMMIQTVILATATSLALNSTIPGLTGLQIFLFTYLVAGALSLLPSLVVSFLFALADKETNEKEKEKVA